MNRLSRVNYYPHIFLIQNRDNNIKYFDTCLVPIKSVNDLDIISRIRLREKTCNGTLYSSVLSEGNAKIINQMLTDIATENNLQEETRIFNLVKEHFGVMII